jgi:hypothetical protein
MVLGYILVCGLGPLSLDAIDGCRVDTRAFTTLAACEELRENVVANFSLPAPSYVDDSRCIVIGTGE